MASNPYTKPLRQLCDANLLRPEPRQCASEKNLKNAVNAKLPDDSEHRLTNINGGRRPTDAAKLAQFDRRARWWAEALRGVCGVDATQTSAHDHECGVHGQCHLPGWAFGEQARAAIPLFRFSPLFLRGCAGCVAVPSDACDRPSARARRIRRQHWQYQLHRRHRPAAHASVVWEERAAKRRRAPRRWRLVEVAAVAAGEAGSRRDAVDDGAAAADESSKAGRHEPVSRHAAHILGEFDRPRPQPRRRVTELRQNLTCVPCTCIL